MIKSFLTDIIKTVFFNIIGIFILYKSSCYVYEHNDIPFLIVVALSILVAIAIYFIKKDFLSPTLEELSKFSIILFLYALKRKCNEIEINEMYESSLNNSTIGGVVKEIIDIADENDMKVKEEKGEKNYD